MLLQLTPTSLGSYDCLKLTTPALTLWVTSGVGPRIIGLAPAGGDNLFAVLPPTHDYRTPAGRTYRFRGGHRLWHAPEDPERTYVPDDAPPALAVDQSTITLTQPVEALTGIEKQITIAPAPDRPRVEVTHRLTNRGHRPVTLAPWAITQLRPGGVGLLPLPTADTGLLPNRRLSLWPYTEINSPYLRWEDHAVTVAATMRNHRLKLGWANPAGWLAYLLDDVLFVKQAPFLPDAPFPDFGANSECYCDDHFLELETLGPLTTLPPNDAVTHTESWSLHTGINTLPHPDDVAALLSAANPPL